MLVCMCAAQDKEPLSALKLVKSLELRNGTVLKVRAPNVTLQYQVAWRAMLSCDEWGHLAQCPAPCALVAGPHTPLQAPKAEHEGGADRSARGPALHVHGMPVQLKAAMQELTGVAGPSAAMALDIKAKQWCVLCCTGPPLPS